MSRRFGVIGYGQFGQFMARHLSQHGEVRAYDPAGGTHGLAEACDVDVLVFAVPVQHLPGAATATAPLVGPQTLIADVSSVKVRPLEILAKQFPRHELLGTHPIFGPQSGKEGIAGLPIVLANVSWTPEHYEGAKRFLSSTFRLNVIERTPEQHDQEMARVQGLAHFIGRALKGLEIKDYETGTLSYHHLVELRDLLKDDSWELFTTIQNENPYAAEARREFLAALQDLEKKLGS